MTKFEKVIMALLVIAIILFAVLLATDNIQIILVIGEKVKTGTEKINWQQVLKVAKNLV